MNAAIEILENSLKEAKEQEKILQARTDRNENIAINEKNLMETKIEIDEILKALNILRRGFL